MFDNIASTNQCWFKADLTWQEGQTDAPNFSTTNLLNVGIDENTIIFVGDEEISVSYVAQNSFSLSQMTAIYFNSKTDAQKFSRNTNYTARIGLEKRYKCAFYHPLRIKKIIDQ